MELILELSYFYITGVGFSFLIVLDIYSIIFVRYIFLISFIVLYYSLFYIDHEANRSRFLILVLTFVGSILVMVLFPSFLVIILGWDGLGVSSFILVIFYNNVSSLRSGILTIYINRLGDIFFIFCFFFLASLGLFVGDFLFLGSLLLLSIFLMLAGISKSAQIPFSSWLPAAISAPTPVSSLVHSSTLVTAGVYLFIRFFYYLRGLFLLNIFYVISLMTFFTAGLMACLENDLKRLVAISTLRQLGLIMFSFCLGNLFITFFHLVRHAVFKSLLFLTCGFIIMIGFSSQDMRFIGRKAPLRKSIYYILFLSVISLVGFSFLRGFFSKDLIIDLIFRERLGGFLFFLFLFSCVLSVFYRLKVVYEAFSGFQLGFFQVVTSSLKLVVFLLGGLFFWSVFFGKRFFHLFFVGEFYIYIGWQKQIGFLLFLLGGFFIVISQKLNLLYRIEFFLWEIAFLNWFFGVFISSKILSISPLLLGEAFWLESAGAKGFFIVLSHIFSWISLSKNFFYTTIFVFLVFSVLFFSLLVSLKKVLFWRNKDLR